MVYWVELGWAVVADCDSVLCLAAQVPFAIAHLRHVVEALGEEYVQGLPLGPIALPDPKSPPPFAELFQQVRTGSSMGLFLMGKQGLRSDH